MDTQKPLEIARKQLGIRRIAEICDVSYEAVRKWVQQGFLPRTEWTGETTYAGRIAAACDGLTAEALLVVRPIDRGQAARRQPFLDGDAQSGLQPGAAGVVTESAGHGVG